MKKELKVIITRKDHPHVGEFGTLTGKMMGGFMHGGFGAIDTRMAEVKLSNCQHGVDACFIGLGDAKKWKA